MSNCERLFPVPSSPLVLGTVEQAPVWSAGGDEVRPGDGGESLDDQVQANIPSKTQPKSE